MRTFVRRHPTLALHLALAAAFPLLGVSSVLLADAGPFAYLLALTAAPAYLLAPLATYVLALQDVGSTALPDEPCTDSGDVLGWSRFSFASDPGRQFWIQQLKDAGPQPLCRTSSYTACSDSKAGLLFWRVLPIAMASALCLRRCPS